MKKKKNRGEPMEHISYYDLYDKSEGCTGIFVIVATGLLFAGGMLVIITMLLELLILLTTY